MTFNGWIQMAVYLAAIVLITRPLGGFLYRVFEGQRSLLSPLLAPVERGIYRLTEPGEKALQRWT